VDRLVHAEPRVMSLDRDECPDTESCRSVRE
jgi:hypothetical protein